LRNLYHLISAADTRLAIVTVLSFFLTFVGVPLARAIAIHFNILAPIDAVPRHRRPMPLLGGAAIIGAILLSIGLLAKLPLWMLIGAAGLFAVGLCDDAVSLLPTRKLILQGLVVIVVLAVWQPPLTLPWHDLNVALTGFWLLSTINAFNLIDGLDGLAAGVGIIAALTIAVLAVSNSDLTMTSQALAVAGALGGFLVFNFHPASIFMGDSGALPLGFMLGALALESGGGVHPSWLARCAIPILLMLVPLLDMTIASVSRAAIGTPVTRRGLDHSHHKLLALGLSDRLAVSICWFVALIAAGSAITVAAMPPAWLFFAIPFIVAFFGLLGSFMIDLTVDALEPEIHANRSSRLARLILDLGYKRRLAEVALDFTLITAAYLGAFLLRFGFAVNDVLVANLLPNVPLVAAISYSAFSIFGLYHGSWRDAGAAEAARLANAAVGSGILLVATSYFLPLAISGEIVVLFVILLFGLLLSSRFSFVAFRMAIGRLASLSGSVHETITLSASFAVSEAELSKSNSSSGQPE